MPNIVREEKKCGHVTFQNRLYMGGHLFKINSQYEFDRIVWLAIGCGCGGSKISHVKHYSVCVTVNGVENKYFVDEKYVVETNIAIPKSAQDFDVARRDQHRNPGTDFSQIVNKPDPASIWQIASRVQPKDRFKAPRNK